MKMPKIPPSTEKVFADCARSPEDLNSLFLLDLEDPIRGKYLHWDKLGYYTPPEGFTHERWWLALKLRRRQQYKRIPLVDNKDIPFCYALVDPIPEKLHQIDQGAGGLIQVPDPIVNPETKDQYYISSLIAEAITSSQLEGAVTTRQVAKEMIKTGRPPRDRSERMILNNFLTMQHIGEIRDKPLSEELVFRIHKTITRQTLDDTATTGRFRQPHEQIVVGDMYNQVFHHPPAAEQLQERMATMCAFANGVIPEHFVHPVIRSIILHFWLAYDHPFVDGNGRAARALFYWSMLQHGFWLFEFVSISAILLKAPAKYGRAFLYTETDENDLTYFILHQLDAIDRAIKELHAYIARRTQRLQALEGQLRGIGSLNHRQRALIGHAMRHPYHQYTIRSHQTSHNVVYQTSRLDLLDLENRGLLRARKVGRTWHFTPVSDLAERLAALE